MHETQLINSSHTKYKYKPWQGIEEAIHINL